MGLFNIWVLLDVFVAFILSVPAAAAAAAVFVCLASSRVWTSSCGGWGACIRLLSEVLGYTAISCG